MSDGDDLSVLYVNLYVLRFVNIDFVSHELSVFFFSFNDHLNRIKKIRGNFPVCLKSLLAIRKICCCFFFFV